MEVRPKTRIKGKRSFLCGVTTGRKPSLKIKKQAHIDELSLLF
jgi:hypothetical protein